MKPGQMVFLEPGVSMQAIPDISLRDYFAAHAMNGLLSLYVAEKLETDPDSFILAEHAYEIADTMLKARNA